MQRIIRIIVLLVALAAGLTVAELQAQQVRPKPAAAEVAVLLRTEGHAGEALQVLTQVRGPQRREKLDEIADTLAAIAISAPADGGIGQRAGSAAIRTLLHAGRAEVGSPYGGAAERLLRIAEEAQDVGARAGALTGLLAMPDSAAALQYLRRVAISQNPVAFVAVGFLARETGPEGLAILRDLHRRGLVTEPLARRELAGIAHYHGWN